MLIWSAGQPLGLISLINPPGDVLQPYDCSTRGRHRPTPDGAVVHDRQILSLHKLCSWRKYFIVVICFLFVHFWLRNVPKNVFFFSFLISHFLSITMSLLVHFSFSALPSSMYLSFIFFFSSCFVSSGTYTLYLYSLFKLNWLEWWGCWKIQTLNRSFSLLSLLNSLRHIRSSTRDDMATHFESGAAV